MRHRIPRKKYRFPGWCCLVLFLLVSVTAAVAQPDSGTQSDRALFWSIRNNGELSGYLLGTIHSEDPRVLDFSEDFIARLKRCDVFAMELVPDLGTLARLTEYMHYPQGQSLQAVVGDERFRALVTALSAYNVPMDFIHGMKPWAAMMTLSTPPPKTGFFMDLSLSMRAEGLGQQVVGLETLEQQLSFLENMPMPMQLSLLDQAIAEYGKIDEAHDQLVEAYLENDLDKIQELSDEQMEKVDQKAGEYFIEAGIRARNLRMFKSLLPYLEKDTVFVAVGALHLPGQHGLINLLRRQGYELNPLDMPLKEAEVQAESR